MSSETTQDRLVRVLNTSLPDGIAAGAVTPASTLSSFGLDSLAMIDLIFDLEQEFGLKLVAADFASIRTIGDLIGFIDRRVKV